MEQHNENNIEENQIMRLVLNTKLNDNTIS